MYYLYLGASFVLPLVFATLRTSTLLGLGHALQNVLSSPWTWVSLGADVVLGVVYASDFLIEVVYERSWAWQKPRLNLRGRVY